jgi:hypothetical protein
MEETQENEGLQTKENKDQEIMKKKKKIGIIANFPKEKMKSL